MFNFSVGLIVCTVSFSYDLFPDQVYLTGFGSWGMDYQKETTVVPCQNMFEKYHGTVHPLPSADSIGWVLCGPV